MCQSKGLDKLNAWSYRYLKTNITHHLPPVNPLLATASVLSHPEPALNKKITEEEEEKKG